MHCISIFLFYRGKIFCKAEELAFVSKRAKNIGVHAPHRITDSFIKVSQAGEEK
jgi:hypothetical protein